MKIDFVSDVSCPWCVIGLKALEEALGRLGDDVQAEIRFLPFELNPNMPPEGQDLYEHMAEKYGSTQADSDRNRDMIRARGEDVGFEFRMDSLRRIYNTFDTHRVLHYAELEGRQHEVKHALFDAYFTQGENPGAHDVLVRVAEACGLDGERVAAILASDDYAEAVREQERYYQGRGIHAVPAVIVNDRHLIQGGQPTDMFEQALRQIASES